MYRVVLKRWSWYVWLLCLLLVSSCNKRERDKAGSISCIADLNRECITIGCMTGIVSTRESMARLPRATHKEYPMPIDAFMAICANKVDAVVLDRPTLNYMALAHPELAVMEEDLMLGNISIAAAKGSQQLMNEVNAFLRKYRADGTYSEAAKRWFETVEPEMPKIPVNVNEGAAPLKIGVTANNEPLCFIKNGELNGYDCEISWRIGAYLGRRVEFVDMPYDALVMGLQSGKIDLAIAFMDAMPEREESVLFSEPYIDAPCTFLVRRELLANGGGSDKNVKQGGVEDSFLHSLAMSFEKTFIREARWKLILHGLAVTMIITFFSVLLGTIMALPLCIILCRSRSKLLALIGESYVSLIVGTPILVILMILYYIIFAKVDINAIVVAIIAFAMDFSAYASVTLRAGIDGIPRGQMEAALALGNSTSAAFMKFVLPQAVRTILPVYRNAVVSTLKTTSIVGYIAIMDLTKMGDIIRSRTYEAFFPLIAIAVIYFLSAKALTCLLVAIEERVSPERRRRCLMEEDAK